jgi:multisubunit Na+/H+ antiporter MnhB subunit
MTARFDLYVTALRQTDLALAQMFLFAVALIVTPFVLRWLPASWQRPVKTLYYAFALIAFLTTVYLSWSVA